MFYGDEIRKKLEDNHALGDRCVCGASALVTQNGYCGECSQKRFDFANEIIGNINLDRVYQIVEFHCTEVDTIEDLRKLMLYKQIYELVDMHFSVHNQYNRDFVEPYNNPSFLELIHEKKAGITCEVLAVLEGRYSQCSSVFMRPFEKRVNVVVEQYKGQLMMQLENDTRNISDLVNYAFSGNKTDDGKVLELVRKYKRIPNQDTHQSR